MAVCSDAANGESQQPDESTGEETWVFEVDAELAGRRLDAALAQLAGVSRSQVQRWIEADRVLVDGVSVRRATKVAAGSVLEASPPPVETSELVAEAIPLDILHEDEDLIVLDKAAGMVVHPAPGHPRGTLVNALLHHCRQGQGDGLASVGGVERPGIVHRLDKGTSGVMVVARNDAAHAALAEQFHDHTIERLYLALVRVGPARSEGRIDRPVGRHPSDRKRMSVRTRSGRPAVTNWKLRERLTDGAALLEVRPETGRTHQIRVHLASSGLPILGDPVYGRSRGSGRSPRDELLDRPALHAAVLGFTHPTSGERVRFEAPLPPDLARALDRLRAESSP